MLLPSAISRRRTRSGSDATISSVTRWKPRGCGRRLRVVWIHIVRLVKAGILAPCDGPYTVHKLGLVMEKADEQ